MATVRRPSGCSHLPPFPMTTHQLTIISGGQTGADRAGLDWAIANGIPHGGWCPQGRKAMDGPLDVQYNLQETPSRSYKQRTRWNVRDTDATVVFTVAPEATDGSLRTLQCAEEMAKPRLHLHPGLEAPHVLLAGFLVKHGVQRLNVAGSREEKEPGLYVWVRAVLVAFAEHHPAVTLYHGVSSSLR